MVNWRIHTVSVRLTCVQWQLSADHTYVYKVHWAYHWARGSSRYHTGIGLTPWPQHCYRVDTPHRGRCPLTICTSRPDNLNAAAHTHNVWPQTTTYCRNEPAYISIQLLDQLNEQPFRVSYYFYISIFLPFNFYLHYFCTHNYIFIHCFNRTLQCTPKQLCQSWLGWYPGRQRQPPAW